jgi:soluble lytic murein transglycosylase-like protein
MLFARENDFDDVILPVAEAQGVDPALLKAMVAAESGFNPAAYHYDANVQDASRGLAQFEGSTWAALGNPGGPGDDATHTGGPYDPNLAVPAMAHFVAGLLSRAGGRVDVAVAAYNSGWSQIRPGDAPRNADGSLVSQAYVNKILGTYYPYFAAQLDGQAPATPTLTDQAPAYDGTTSPLFAGLLSVAFALGIWWYRRNRRPRASA